MHLATSYILLLVQTLFPAWNLHHVNTVQMLNHFTYINYDTLPFPSGVNAEEQLPIQVYVYSVLSRFFKTIDFPIFPVGRRALVVVVVDVEFVSPVSA